MSDPAPTQVQSPEFEDPRDMARAELQYLRSALRYFRDHLSDASHRAVLSFYAVHEHENLSMEKCLRTMRIHNVLWNASLHASRHFDFTAKAQHFAALRKYSIIHKGEAHAKRLRSVKLIDKAKRALANRDKPGFHRANSVCSAKTFKTAMTSARSLSSRRLTPSVAVVSPVSSPTAAGAIPVASSQDVELDSFKDQLRQANRNIAEMERIMVERDKMLAQVKEDQLRQAVEESLGPGAASPARVVPNQDVQVA